MQQFENINNVKYYEVCCGGNSNLNSFLAQAAVHTQKIQ